MKLLAGKYTMELQKWTKDIFLKDSIAVFHQSFVFSLEKLSQIDAQLMNP